MPGQYDLGPYYRTSRRAMEGQRRALGYQPMSSEQIAGERYGEVSAYLGDERQRNQYNQDLELRKQALGLQGRSLRNQESAQQAGEWGQAVSGVATGVNVLDKLGAFNKGGLLGKAYTGIFQNQGGGEGTINLTPGGWTSDVSPNTSNFGFGYQAPSFDFGNTFTEPNIDWFNFNMSW